MSSPFSELSTLSSTCKREKITQMKNTRAAGVSDISFESFLSNSAGFQWETQEMLIRHEKVEQQKVDPALKDVIRGNNRKEAPFL